MSLWEAIGPTVTPPTSAGPLWTDVLSAVSTAVGVVAAIVAGIFAALAYRREVLRDRARDDELRELRDRETQAQASLVAVWLSNEGPIPRDAEVLPRIRVRNGSQIPVYSTVVTFRDTRRRRPLAARRHRGPRVYPARRAPDARTS